MNCDPGRGVPAQWAMAELHSCCPTAPDYAVTSRRSSLEQPWPAPWLPFLLIWSLCWFQSWLWNNKLNNLASNQQNFTFFNFTKTKTSCFLLPWPEPIFYHALPSPAAGPSPCLPLQCWFRYRHGFSLLQALTQGLTCSQRIKTQSFSIEFLQGCAFLSAQPFTVESVILNWLAGKNF